MNRHLKCPEVTFIANLHYMHKQKRETQKGRRVLNLMNRFKLKKEKSYGHCV